MGRSFRRVGHQDSEILSRNISYYHLASDRHYSVYHRDGRYFQRRYQKDSEGRESNVVEKEIHYVVGSGNHTRTYLHRSPDGRIVELPLAWYASNGGFWAMNPGYDRPDHDDMRRRITYECMFCHNAYPQLPSGADRPGSDPLFPADLPNGIDCQRCHGPGADHIRLVRSGHSARQVRKAIVNPSRLTRDRQMEVCMQCHLETTSFPLPHSIHRYERTIFSYRPGEPLGSYMVHFDHAAGRGYDDKFEIAHQAYRLRKSACFIKSGSMTCTTCHNPHRVQSGDSATGHYAQVCLGCHTNLNKLVANQRHSPAQDCQTCHMPKRRTDDVVHVVMTDHFIQRRRPSRDLLAPLSEKRLKLETRYTGEVVPYYPLDLKSPEDELAEAVAQVKHNTNLNGGLLRLERAIEKHRPARAEYYFELGEAHWNNGSQEKAFRAYEQALERNSDFWPALHALGTGLAKVKQTDRAISLLEHAVRVSTASAASLIHLGLALLDRDRTDEAVRTLKQALHREPESPEGHNALGAALLQRGEPSAAEAAFAEAVRFQPDYAEAHKNLAGTALARGDLASAQRSLTAALKHKPAYAEAHVAFGDTLALQNELSGAIEHYREALALEPASVAANFGLGASLAAIGRTLDAKRYLAEALKGNPNHHESHLQLGAILLSQQEAAAAKPHLGAASQSADPQIRAEALRLLNR